MKFSSEVVLLLRETCFGDGGDLLLRPTADFLEVKVGEGGWDVTGELASAGLFSFRLCLESPLAPLAWERLFRTSAPFFSVGVLAALPALAVSATIAACARDALMLLLRSYVAFFSGEPALPAAAEATCLSRVPEALLASTPACATLATLLLRSNALFRSALFAASAEAMAMEALTLLLRSNGAGALRALGATTATTLRASSA